MSKLSNCLRMIELLQARGKMKISELAGELEVKERMVRVYRDELEKAGIYIEGEQGRGGGYSLSRASFFPTKNMAGGELEALIFAVKQLSAKDTVYSEAAQVALDKLRAVQRTEEEKDRYIHFVQRSRPNDEQSDDHKKYVQLQSALTGRYKVKLAYTSATSSEERTVRPYGFVYYNEFFYCAAFCELRQQLRTFKLSRIERLEPLQERYEIPQSFDIREEWSGLGIMRDEPMRVKLLISPPFARSVPESVWGENQSIQHHKDGSILFQAAMNGKQSIKKWILSMGAAVRVLEPAELQAELVEEYKNMLASYSFS
ncbi:helix-turn-helix transcriptional regulator [Ectobacillus ponti]|uniref:Transcriptional regulator n=1 Tax=Ectobacillus ponti TaxID=2961894 RepID=A0AA41X8L0_9BACI|nr:transcriptional regulator [Ectobacillus ponti]MCP8970904.1 transcriptional regulator [Ectobacillus ponti]